MVDIFVQSVAVYRSKLRMVPVQAVIQVAFDPGGYNRTAPEAVKVSGAVKYTD